MGAPLSDLPVRARIRGSSLTDTKEGRTFFGQRREAVVLPPDLCEPLRPLLDESGAVKREPRPQRMVLEELRASREALTLSAEELRAPGLRGDLR